MPAKASAPAPAVAREFEIVARRKDGKQWLSQASTYSVGTACVKGEVEVHGDLLEAVRFQAARAGNHWKRQAFDAICRWNAWQLTQRWASRTATARNIRFHYDRSNDFYRLFLHSQMVYSCAHFNTPDTSLTHTQPPNLTPIS